MNILYEKLIMILAVVFYVPMSAAIEIVSIEDCNQKINRPSIYSVLGHGRNTLSGWSHIDTSLEEFRGLKLSNDVYKIRPANVSKPTECNGMQHAVLVSKLSDWTHQHANGFEELIDNNSVSFGDVEEIVIDLKINGQETYIPSEQELINRYGDLLSTEKIKSLDRSQLNLGIVLFAEGALDQNTETFNTEFILEIDHLKQADQWLRLVIPLKAFSSYTEQNYSRTHKPLTEFLKHRVHGIRINPETSNGKQLRNLLADEWHDGIAETFKEMSISLARIEFLKKQ